MYWNWKKVYKKSHGQIVWIYIEKEAERDGEDGTEIWKFMRGLLGFYGSLRG